MPGNEKKLLGQILIEQKLITTEQLKEALKRQEKTYNLLGTILIKMDLISEDEVLSCLALQQGATRVELSKTKIIDPEVVRIIPEQLARRFFLIPIARDDRTLTVAMADPIDIVAIDTIKINTGYEVKPVLSFKKEVLEAIDKHYGEFVDIGKSIQDIVDVEAQQPEAEKFDTEPLKVEAEDAPVVRFVNLLLLQAVGERASDIHIEPGEKGVNIRLRIDGVLRKVAPPPKRMHSAIVSRIKIMSNLDIAERRLPQDGKCRVRIGPKKIDIRVATIPTIYGEKVVMRILDRSTLLLSLNDLGFEREEQRKFRDALARPYGMVLLTGPTGSGKSTTLYAGLNYINSPEKNIVTVEDPVEYELEGINQIQVKPQIGLTFAQGLRHILRQDPDIIMVGEIRDLETAEIAVHAALTGHLVLSTLHTNDAVSAINRLVHMGIKPYLIAASLNLVIAQRLARRICSGCKEPHTLPTKMLDRLNPLVLERRDFKFSRGKGCVQCGNTGHLGRVALYEVFVLSTRIKDLILSGTSESVLKQEATREGMRSLWESGVRKVLEGISTFEELLSITSDGKETGVGE